MAQVVLCHARFFVFLLAMIFYPTAIYMHGESLLSLQVPCTGTFTIGTMYEQDMVTRL